MADSAQLAFEDVKGGMNASDPPNKIAVNQVARMVNCAIVDGFPTTRMGVRVVPLSGDSREFISLANVQGSIFYNPAKGQGGIQFAPSNSSIALAAGGSKFLVRIQGRKPSPVAVAENITALLFTRPQNHLAWMQQCEDLLVMADGDSNTLIYSPINGIRFSLGYNEVEKDLSEIPNGCTVLAYAHSRIAAVSNSRNILVGDNLNRQDQTTSGDLVRFTEQVYWATGQSFIPPSAMGAITAAAILPLKNTVHGHADLLLHCEDGVFSLDLNEYPRSNWPNLQLVKHALLQGGATGPYAIDITDGDQMFRSRKGAMSLRSAAASTDGTQGNPEKSLSAEVDTWLSGDYHRWLRFASVSLWDHAKRCFFSTAPIVQGSFRWHRGVVVRNIDPVLTSSQDVPIWEGLWTFAPEMRGIIQMVHGLFDCEDRQFAWCRGWDGRNRLVEFCTWLREDILEDGTHHPIRAQCITRRIDAAKPWMTREFKNAKLFLRNVEGLVSWGVWFRTAESPTWRFWKAGTVEVPYVKTNPFDLTMPDPRSLGIPLGDLPKDCQCDLKTPSNETVGMQFLVRWEGYCQFEGIRVVIGETDVANDQIDPAKFKIVFKEARAVNYDDFEYSETPEKTWLSQ